MESVDLDTSSDMYIHMHNSACGVNNYYAHCHLLANF